MGVDFSICTCVCAMRRVDGLHRLKVSLRPFLVRYGSVGLLTGHGSGLKHSASPRFYDLFIHYSSGVATSTSFHCNWPITSVLNAAYWRSSSVFTSFYLKDLFFKINGLRSLGPLVAAGVQII